MTNLPNKGEYVLKTRREERMAHWFVPFLEASGYKWTIEVAEEYGEDVVILKYEKV